VGGVQGLGQADVGGLAPAGVVLAVAVGGEGVGVPVDLVEEVVVGVVVVDDDVEAQAAGLVAALSSIASRNRPRCSGLTLADTTSTYTAPPRVR